MVLQPTVLMDGAKADAQAMKVWSVHPIKKGAPDTSLSNYALRAPKMKKSTVPSEAVRHEQAKRSIMKVVDLGSRIHSNLSSSGPRLNPTS